MSSTRKFVYATLLALTTLTFAPSKASAQEPASGRFTLTHDVRWSNAKVLAGEYRFSFTPNGVSGVLLLTRLDGARSGYMLPVRDTEEAKPSDLSRLILNGMSGGSYVSAMQLPEFGMTLHFATPQIPEKQLARTVTAARASGQ